MRSGFTKRCFVIFFFLRKERTGKKKKKKYELKCQLKLG